MQGFLRFKGLVFTFLCISHPVFARISIEQEKKIISFCVENHVQEYIRQKIESAEIMTAPFPHLAISEILPRELYNRAISLWPGQAHFKGNGARKKIATTYGCIENTGMIEEKRVFWRTFGEVVVKHYIKPLIIEKFKPYIHWKFPFLLEEELENVINNLNFYSYRYDSLVIDLPEYQIEPHIDGIKTFIQAIIYFPSDASHQDLGTTLYSGSIHKKPLNEQKGAAILEHNDDLKVEKKIPYLPNTLVAFIQSPKSWHGMSSESPDPNYLRRSYFLDIRLSPESMQKVYGDTTSLSKSYLHDFLHLYPENW